MVALAATRGAVLPARFSFDAHLIQRLAQGAAKGDADRSFLNTAAFYRLLGLQDLPVAVTVLTIALFAVATFAGIVRSGPRNLTVPAAALAGVGLVLGAAYLGTYSKDTPVLLVALALVLGGRRMRWEIPVLAAIVVYASLFRSYWFLILALFVLLRVLQRLRLRTAVWPLVIIVGIVAVALLIAFVLGEAPDYFRSAVNLQRAGVEDARTMLRPIVVGPEPLAGLANVLIAFVCLQVPVPLALLGGPYYITVAVSIAAVWGTFWWGAVRNLRSGGADPQGARAVAFVLAFVVVQSFFEPDYGSALRHLTPLLPVMAFVVMPRGASAIKLARRGRVAGAPTLVPTEVSTSGSPLPGASDFSVAAAIAGAEIQGGRAQPA